MRLQTDTLDQPLNINSGTKLELGSSAKFRTLATILRPLSVLHEQYHSLSRAELAAVECGRGRQPEPCWVISYLSSAGNRDLSTMLAAAMQRRYLASPKEHFFTGGGVHTFSNFDKRDDTRIFSRAGCLQSLYQPGIYSINARHYPVLQISYSRCSAASGMLKTPGGMTIYPILRIRRGAFFFSAFTEKYRGKSL